MASSVEKEIYQNIDRRQSFVLDAGAGSGKTFSLVQALLYIINHRGEELKRESKKVMCITYTRVARDEIIKRIERSTLVNVTTIHDFLWDCVSQFQKELQVALLNLINRKIEKINEKLVSIKNKNTKGYTEQTEKLKSAQENYDSVKASNSRIKYGQYPYFKEKIVSHDEVIEIAEFIFANYPDLRKIVADAYPIIFVDEYQDTHVPVVNILLQYLATQPGFIVGFFGDKMQKIYSSGVGDVTTAVHLKQIKKNENFRCSKSVVALLNKIRSDITQVCPEDSIQGSINFYFSPNKLDVGKIIEDKFNLRLVDFKALYLTHNLISKENGYAELYDVYNSYGKQDSLTRNEDNRGRCPFADFLYDIEGLADLYKNDKIQSVLKETIFEVSSFKRKLELNNLLLELLILRETKTINGVIDFVVSRGVLAKTKKMELYDLGDADKLQFFERLMEIPYQQFINLFQVQNHRTPFSTKHSTKGEEFDNVLVVIDDKSWTMYNFEKYFSNDMSNVAMFERTRNLFYVVCSRAKQNLVICFQGQLNSAALETVKTWFGVENISTL